MTTDRELDKQYDLSRAALPVVAEAIRAMRDLGCSSKKIANILAVAVEELSSDATSGRPE
jgi:hypothetical protein